ASPECAAAISAPARPRPSGRSRKSAAARRSRGRRGSPRLARDQVDQGRHALVALALVDLGIIAPELDDLEIAERLAQQVLGVEVLEHARPARLVLELLRSVALDEQKAAWLERRLHAL